MKRFLTLLASCVLTLSLQAQHEQGITHSGQPTGQSPFPLEHYRELNNPVKTDSTLWKKTGPVQISWASADLRYPKEKPYTGQQTTQLTRSAWRGEKVNGQFVVWGTEHLEQLHFEVSPLRHRKAAYSIPKENLLTGFVRYVLTDELNKDKRGSCGARTIAHFDSTLVADPIDHLTNTLPYRGYTTQGCWIGIQVPTEAPSGSYAGEIVVKDGDRTLQKLQIALQVSERALPEVKEWAFHLDLWQNPYAIARYHRTEPWSDAHLEAMRPYMELYRNAGGKVVTASIMHKPWNGQTYDFFESMVTWTRKVDGTWQFDYDVFDRWVEFMFGLGINKQINCYSMVPWRLSFQYFDQATNQLKEIATQPGEKAYEELWTAMLQSFARHLKEKGWFDKTYISMDERPMEVMLETLKIIRKADPEFKISLAGALHPELINELDDYCVALRMKYTDEMLERRKAAGKITTFYTSCEEPHPNTFTFCHPTDCQWFGWYAAKAHLDGYLRWALNSWVIEPLLDSRFYSFGAGDTYLIYPGARTCIRFEQLIQGVQAYEKIRLLRLEYRQHPNVLQQIDRALTYIDEQTLSKVPSEKAIRKAQQLLRKIGF